MNLDASQDRFCQSPGSHVRLLAPAGSGKTLSLLWRCKRLSERDPAKPQRFLIFTFTRVARDELRHRLQSDPSFQSLKGDVRVDTLNAWGYNYLRKQVNSAISLKTTKPQLFALVKHNLRPIWTKTKNLEETLSKQQKRFVDLVEVMNAMKTCGFRHDAKNLKHGFSQQLAWIKECGLGRYFESHVETPLKRIDLLSEGEDPPEERFGRFLKFWKSATDHLWDSALITLDDQKYWTLITLQQRYQDSHFPEPNRYHHVLVDEFQDINPLDLFLIRELVRVNRSTVSIIGDDDQAIFEWRGAVPKFILHPEEFFGAPFESHTLEVNYRSPTNILDHSQRLIRHNRIREPKNVSAARNHKAEVIHRHFPTHDDAASLVLDLAREANKRGTPKGLAVLTRKHSQLIPLEIMLTSEDIPFYAKEDLNVLLSEAFSELRTILEAIATQRDRRSMNDVVDTFLKCCHKVQTYPLPRTQAQAIFGYLMSKRPKTLIQCIESFQSYEGSLRGDPLDFALPIAQILEAETVTAAIDLIEERMQGLQRHYGKGEDDIFYKDPPFPYLAEHARRYGSDFLRFVDDVDEAIAATAYTARPEGEEDSVDPDLHHPVHLMTALRAKGKEFHTVVILDANDGMWPIRWAETEEEVEQERRLFYVGVTRAQERLLFLSVDELGGRPVELTPYLAEMGLLQRSN